MHASLLREKPRIQAKLRVNAPNDAFEREADRMAERVVRGQAAEGPQHNFSAFTQVPVSRKCAACEAEEPSGVQRKSEEDDIVQANSATGGFAIGGGFESQLNARKGGGAPLDDNVRGQMEQGFGADFGGVRIHTGGEAAGLSRQINAKAFTHGKDVFFGAGEYQPQTAQGKRLLAHELTHTLQQGAAPAIQRECNVQEALDWYQTSDTGKTVVYSQDLVEQLFNAIGPDGQSLYDAATNECTGGVIGDAFVALVCRAQEALGFSGDDVDGKFGKNTSKRLRTFQMGGDHGIDYNRLMEDGKLEIGIGVGADFSSEFNSIVTLLLTENFTLVSDTNGVHVYSAKRNYEVQGNRNAPQREIEVIITLISQNTTDPRDEFEDILTDQEIALYSGHARYGTGPDFDSKKSPAENFVIGVNSALHENNRLTSGYNAEMNEVLEDRANDLERLSAAGEFDAEMYRVWFMNACSSIHYLDEIRGGLVTDASGTNLSEEDLRVMYTNRSIYSDALPIVQGILNMDTMEEIVAAMNAYESNDPRSDGPRNDYYSAD